VFRNVGILNSEAGELPRRKHTTTKFNYGTGGSDVTAVTLLLKIEK